MKYTYLNVMNFIQQQQQQQQPQPIGVSQWFLFFIHFFLCFVKNGAAIFEVIAYMLLTGAPPFFGSDEEAWETQGFFFVKVRGLNPEETKQSPNTETGRWKQVGGCQEGV